MNRREFGALSTCAITFAPLTGFAHRIPQTHTLIEWNAPQSALDVTHTFHAHDTEALLKSRGILRSADISMLSARARLSHYVEKQFFLKSLGGETIMLELIGAEQERQNIYVFQSAKLVAPPDGLKVNCTLLRDEASVFRNQVDVQLGSEIRSMSFKGDDGEKIILA